MLDGRNTSAQAPMKMQTMFDAYHFFQKDETKISGEKGVHPE